ncbi:MAG: DUF1566 domain-containing protein [Rikenellaceae bacterium]
MKRKTILAAGILVASSIGAMAQNYKIVDTGQTKFFDDTKEIAAPQKGQPFYGQDAAFQGIEASYTDNGDGTIIDNVTGLVWQKAYEVMSYKEAVEAAKKLTLAGKSDWRLPTIKEAYSLILFSGSDVNPELSGSGNGGNPFVNTEYFDFKYAANGNRAIDSQMLTSSLYVGSTETENLVFGVNFADGRIKGYGLGLGGQDKQFMVRFVRGAAYGVNDFKSNGDGTISDKATSLMWSAADSKSAMNWEEALAYAEEMNAEGYLGYSDWRVPNAKELQSIVDYSRSPLTTSSAAIDPLFESTVITDEAGCDDYAFYWTSTTHENSGTTAGGAGIYVAFGRSLGNMSNSQGMPQMGGVQGGQGGQRPQMQGRPPQGQQQGQMQGQQGQRPEGARPEGQMQGQGRPEGGGQHPGGSNMRAKSTEPNWVDIHGAGSQRSDPKSGDASIYADGHGPQGDAIRIYNFVRLVRDL